MSSLVFCFFYVSLFGCCRVSCKYSQVGKWSASLRPVACSAVMIMLKTKVERCRGGFACDIKTSFQQVRVARWLFAKAKQLLISLKKAKRSKWWNKNVENVIFGWKSSFFLFYFYGALLAEMIRLVEFSRKGPAKAVCSVSVYVNRFM